MKALVLEAYNQFSYQEMPVPEFVPDEVLVQVKACGICGSDVHGMDGSTGRRIPPIIMGHEAAGVIVKSEKMSKIIKSESGLLSIRPFTAAIIGSMVRLPNW